MLLVGDPSDGMGLILTVRSKLHEPIVREIIRRAPIAPSTIIRDSESIVCILDCESCRGEVKGKLVGVVVSFVRCESTHKSSMQSER